MKTPAKELKYFFNSQQLADGIRITLAVLLPALVLSYFNQFNTGLTISLGALCVSLADAPGPIVHRKNGMLFCLFFVFVVAIITAYAQLNIYVMGLEILLFSFFFSMFNAYGNRATSVGNAALLVMVLSMDSPLAPSQILPHALFILSGGAFYMFLSLVSYQIRPYRLAQRALGECVRELAAYLNIKADFYDTTTDLNDDYKRLVAQQMMVSEKQDSVRELLFKTRQILKESTNISRRLVLTFVDTVDLFEDITVTYYDYVSIRKRYGETDLLKYISTLIKKMAHELDNIGIAIQANEPYHKNINYNDALLQIKNQIDIVTKQEAEVSNLGLKKILVNMRKMVNRFNDVLRYFDVSALQAGKSNKVEYTLFVGHQSLDPKILWDNLSLKSSVFKHAFRVSLACIIGFIIAKFMAYGHHGYWIVMTIAFMLKPGFSLTKQRNYERIIGTLVGGIIGVFLLLLVKDKYLLFGIMVFLMIGTYSFQRVQYLVSVIFMTPFIIILFKFLGVAFVNLAQERILDTALGCFIAFLASYLVFPSWQSEQLQEYFYNMLKANSNYLQKLLEGLAGKTISITEYKLARKDVYVSSANLSAAFQRMLSEPKSKQKSKREIHQFVVLNHILFSNIATIASVVVQQPARVYPSEIIRSAKKIIAVLNDSLKKFDMPYPLSATHTIEEKQNETSLSTSDDLLLKEQLDFMFRISRDISKTTDAIMVV